MRLCVTRQCEPHEYLRFVEKQKIRTKINYELKRK